MDHLSIIAATVTIVDGTAKAYQVVKKILSLSRAFNETRRQLPLVCKTRKAAKSRLGNEPAATKDEDRDIRSIVEGCQKTPLSSATSSSRSRKRCKIDAEAIIWTKVRSAYRTVLAGLKANRLEALMQQVIKSI